MSAVEVVGRGREGDPERLGIDSPDSVRVGSEANRAAADRAGGFHLGRLIEHCGEEQRVPGAPCVELPAADREAVGRGHEAQSAEGDDAAVVVVADVRPAREHDLGAIRKLRRGDRLSGGELVQQGKRQWGVVAAGEGSGEGFGERVDRARRHSRTACWGRG
jgi:hypothetical protein